MKLIVKQDSLSKALSAVSRIAGPKAGLPILADVLVRTDQNKLIIAATNLELAVIAETGAQIDEEGAIAIPARLLTEVISNLPHVNIELSTEETKLHVKAATVDMTINCNSADEYPALPELKDGSELTLSGKDLKKAISGTIIAAGNDLTRPILTGVYLHSSDGELYMAATDGYRLAEQHIGSYTGEQPIATIIPHDTLSDVARLITDDDVSIKYNDEQITFTLGSSTVTSRLIDGKYIDYAQLMPKDTDFVIAVNRSDLQKALRLASPFAQVTQGTIILEGDVSAKSLSVRTVASQLGNNTSAIDAEFTASGDKPCTVNVNSRFLADALNCLDGDTATIHFNGPMTPLLLTGESPDYRHLIMPVR